MKNNKLAINISIICYGVSALIFSAIGLIGVFLTPGGELGYVVFMFYLVMPATTLITSIIVSIEKGYLFWFYPLFVGFGGLLIPFVVFHSLNLFALFFAGIPALIGLLIGMNKRFIQTKNT